MRALRWRPVAGRLVSTLAVLLGVSLIVFLLLQLVPGDPARAAEWYEKAAKLGDDLAATHLEALGRR